LADKALDTARLYWLEHWQLAATEVSTQPGAATIVAKFKGLAATAPLWSVGMGRSSRDVHLRPLPRPTFRRRRRLSAAVCRVGSSIGSSSAADRPAVIGC